MKKRNDKTLFVVFGLGIGYFIWLRLSGPAIPCLFRKITGWLCPGCGITTLILCLARLDLAGAFAANPFLFVTWPLLAAGILYSSHLQKQRKDLPKWMEWLLMAYTIGFCIFGIFRNFK